jgi:hypothetical protein
MIYRRMGIDLLELREASYGEFSHSKLVIAVIIMYKLSTKELVIL